MKFLVSVLAFVNYKTLVGIASRLLRTFALPITQLLTSKSPRQKPDLRYKPAAAIWRFRISLGEDSLLHLVGGALLLTLCDREGNKF